jgi:hypothetical protein
MEPSAVAPLTIDTTQWTADVEARAIAASAGRVSRNGPLLEVRLPSGGSKSLRDEANGNNAVRFVYLGELDSLPYQVIGIVPPQLPHMRLILLDERSGVQYGVPGVPIVSPDQQRFFIISTERWVDHSIQVWSLTDTGPRFEWGPGHDDQPIDGQWHDDSTVMYRVVDTDKGSRADTAWVELPFRAGRWQAARRLTP